MRVRICQEGVQEIPGHIIMPGALKWEDKKYPICWENNFNEVMGWASDIQRDGDNVITVDVDLDSMHPMMQIVFDAVGTTIYANELVEKKEEGKRKIVSATVRALFCTLGVPWKNPPVRKEDSEAGRAVLAPTEGSERSRKRQDPLG